MKDNKNIQAPDVIDQEKSVTENVIKEGVWSRNAAKIITGVISLALLIFIIVMIIGIGDVGPKAAGKAYDTAKNESKAEEYESAYNMGYEWAESVHHTSNVAHISIEKLQEKSDLEVLVVSYDQIETTDDTVTNAVSDFLDSLKDLIYEDKISLWQKFTCKGAYSVNLKQAEFIVDNAQSYVLVRLPQPTISKVDIVSSERLYAGEGGLFNDPSEGRDLTAQQRADAQEKVLQALQNHEVYMDAARDSAERFIVNFIKELNPEEENLMVEIEFVE